MDAATDAVMTFEAEPVAELLQRQQALEAEVARIDEQRAATVALVTVPFLERLYRLVYPATAEQYEPKI